MQGISTFYQPMGASPGYWNASRSRVKTGASAHRLIWIGVR
ncbi:hypothetical protein CA85_12410 [Allorhodopirellula solitaria]|uniref:Uncharacterized protein n=1 Tax=Allorhodopirellula solitaria TaxID=2527987 RepID=A0A5C5YH52_9BACT|nr:hypothetical protein CA85_12410 [Allorhodopirellula solitaria]